MKDAINQWGQVGVVHLWRYKPEKSGLKGWHFHADEAGLKCTIGLVELLGAATYPAKRTLNLTKPSERTVNGPFSPLGGRKIIAPVSLQLSTDGHDTKDLWQLEEEGERVKLHLGRQALAELLGGCCQTKSHNSPIARSSVFEARA
ncbi:hypothetical protein H9L12_00960 [Sphingomonas rhizophila]|uniref:Uncharacterized protein n=1 Tax=Sphingomonas rhizophila TaxID=2071607 RepID=A0A7G9SBM6_9SPHN|nr:hypothetical protein [Sphingomonas rhizophila]QNN65251.1 hypothetical protein H9L12_00960 [Sphingomonas rhizophila]